MAKKKSNRFTQMKSKFVSLQTKAMRNFILGLLDVAEKTPEADYFIIPSEDSDVKLEFTVIDPNRIIAYCGKASLEILDTEDETYIAANFGNSMMTADKTLNLMKKLNERFGFS